MRPDVVHEVPLLEGFITAPRDSGQSDNPSFNGEF